MTRYEKAARSIAARVAREGSAHFSDKGHAGFLVGSLLVKWGYRLESLEGDRVIVRQR